MLQMNVSKAAVVAFAAVLLLGVMSTASAERESPFVKFPKQDATITITNNSISISPSQLEPGPTTFTITNQSDQPRGVYVSGDDRTGNPIIGYSAQILPGQTTHMSFWMYQGNAYTFRDYTSKSIVGDRTHFGSTYSAEVSIPMRVALRPIPKYDLQRGSIRITNDGIDITPNTAVFGPIEFTVTNDTNQTRGVVIAGEDRSGSSLFRYSPRLLPGESTQMHFWLYEGRNYTVMDYSGPYYPVAGRSFGSSFRSALSVAPGRPAPFGVGPSTPEDEMIDE